ncbi:MAG: hypothetical protein JSV24_01135 [Bacteroidales bacterium]|nr:MAG: hypothetical protein JSV24_01135 [Bacteroidales bacterium]
MKRIVLYIAWALFSLMSFGQGSQEYVAMLFSLDGEGEYIRNNKSESLMVPQNYIKGDKILLKSGTATLMLFSGDEINLRAGEEYIVPGIPGGSETSGKRTTFNSVTELIDEDHERISQRNAAYKVRGAFSAVKAFPSLSGLIDNSYAEVVLNVDVHPNFQFSLEIYDQVTDELVWKTDKIETKEVSLKAVNFEPGKNYYWSLKARDVLDIGIINVYTEAETLELEKFDLNEKIDYLTAYNYYKGKELMYDARHVLKLAIDEFAENDLFEYLLEHLEIPE